MSRFMFPMAVFFLSGCVFSSGPGDTGDGAANNDVSNNQSVNNVVINGQTGNNVTVVNNAFN